jgi:hypothetical protein
MNYSDNTRISGLVDGVAYGQFDRTDEINSRIFERSVPDLDLAPNFGPRPVPTKYSVFPILDSRMPTIAPIEPNFDYSLHNTFTPPVSKKGPVAGYFNNIDVETELRSQFFALQKGADQSIYVPRPDSDLYKVYITSKPSNQPFPGLFIDPKLDQTLNENIQSRPDIGRDMFNNNTRTQLRNTTIM